MTALKWTSDWDAFADPYIAADVIQQYYKTNSHYPAQWADPALKELFVPSTKTANTTNSTATPTHTSSPTPIPASSNHTGAIAGGAVGGSAFFALLALLAWYIHHQKAKKRTAAAKAERKAQAPLTVFEKSELPSPPPKYGGLGAEMQAGGAHPFPGGLQDGSRQDLPAGMEGGHGNEHSGRAGLHEM